MLNKIELSREIIDIFETIVVTSLGKSFQALDTSTQNIKLKDNGKKGILLPTLEKNQSILDMKATEQLLGQAYSIVFNELQAFVDFAQRFDGISWKVFVRLMNRHRKTGTYIKQDFPGGSDLGQSEALLRTGLSGGDLFGEPAPDYGDEEYEGGEGEEVFPDLDNELSKQERIKEEIELGKF